MPNEKMTAANFRLNLGSVLNKVTDGAHIEVTRHGAPLAVLLSINEYRTLTSHRDNNQDT